MSLDNVDDSVKVIVVGDGNVGKTSMLRRFCKGEFTDQYKKTIGAEFMEKEVYVKSKNQSITLMLWDTAGQEVFNALTASYYRGAGVAILAFSTTDRDSFFNVEKWKTKIEQQTDKIPMILCQTKMDLMDQSAISNQETEAMATKLNVPFFRTSTKDNFNVAQLFEYTAEQALSLSNLDGGVQSIMSPVGKVESSAGKDGNGEGKKKEKKEKKDKKGDKNASSDNVDEEGQDEAPKGPVNMKQDPKKDKKKKTSGWSCSMV